MTHFAPILLAGGLVLATSVPSWAGEDESFTIDTKYPGGNAIVESINGDTIHLRPDLRDTEGWWFYWNFKVSGVSGRTLTSSTLTGRNPIGRARTGRQCR